MKKDVLIKRMIFGLLAGVFVLLWQSGALTGIFSRSEQESASSAVSSQSAESSEDSALSSQVSSEPTSSALVESEPAEPTLAQPQSDPEAEEAVPPVPQVELAEAKQPLWVEVSIKDQIVTVYDADNQVVQGYICSTGTKGAETPTGTFTVKERGESFFSKRYQQGAYHWTQFQGDYLFHSIPFDANRELIPEEAEKLGVPASHGCVRLSLENAKWIYDNIPRGAKIVIE